VEESDVVDFRDEALAGAREEDELDDSSLVSRHAVTAKLPEPEKLAPDQELSDQSQQERESGGDEGEEGGRGRRRRGRRSARGGRGRRGRDHDATTPDEAAEG